MAYYSKQEYWDNRYQTHPQPFEWYLTYKVLEPTIKAYIKQSDKILHIGCGTSYIAEELYNNGYKNVTNIDFSNSLIQSMLEKHKANPSLKFITMDTKKMEFADNSFDILLDKATFDSVACSDTEPECEFQMISECYRVLSYNGIFICISNLIHRDKTRESLLHKFKWDITSIVLNSASKIVEGEKEIEPCYAYICKKCEPEIPVIDNSIAPPSKKIETEPENKIAQETLATTEKPLQPIQSPIDQTNTKNQEAKNNIPVNPSQEEIIKKEEISKQKEKSEINANENIPILNNENNLKEVVQKSVAAEEVKENKANEPKSEEKTEPKKDEIKIEEPKVEEPKKEELKKEEPKKEELKVEEPKKEEPKKEVEKPIELPKEEIKPVQEIHEIMPKEEILPHSLDEKKDPIAINEIKVEIPKQEEAKEKDVTIFAPDKIVEKASDSIVAPVIPAFEDKKEPAQPEQATK